MDHTEEHHRRIGTIRFGPVPMHTAAVVVRGECVHHRSGRTKPHVVRSRLVESTIQRSVEVDGTFSGSRSRNGVDLRENGNRRFCPASLEACNGGDVSSREIVLSQAGWIESKRKQRRAIVSRRIRSRGCTAVENVRVGGFDRQLAFVVVTVALTGPPPTNVDFKKDAIGGSVSNALLFARFRVSEDSVVVVRGIKHKFWNGYRIGWWPTFRLATNIQPTHR